MKRNIESQKNPSNSAKAKVVSTNNSSEELMPIENFYYCENFQNYNIENDPIVHIPLLVSIPDFVNQLRRNTFLQMQIITKEKIHNILLTANQYKQDHTEDEEK